MPQSGQGPVHACAIPNAGVNSLQDVAPAFMFIAPALENNPPIVGLLSAASVGSSLGWRAGAGG